MDQPSDNEYVYKYSGGLGTYCSSHRPFAIYCAKADRTYFCYGGTTADSNTHLLHMISYYDHASGKLRRPVCVIDKDTSDAHDNPVLSIDSQGYIWIFSTSHGFVRPSFIHRSSTPYEIDHFIRIDAKLTDPNGEKPFDNFSYFQVWHDRTQGFQAFHTSYKGRYRTICFISSKDGQKWENNQTLAAIEMGHYQVSAMGKGKVGCAFNMHPQGKGLNWRTNLYYLESDINGVNWRNADGKSITIPLTERNNAALIHDYAAEGLNVYVIDLKYDRQNRPVIVYLTSKGYESGPANGPRIWRIAKWRPQGWQISDAFNSDNNYDMGELIIGDKEWLIIAPTEAGPQPYNTGGEVALWRSTDEGAHWSKEKDLTWGSERNHTYVRTPVNGRDDFLAFWADGNARKPSESLLYYTNRSGQVYQMPLTMKEEFEAGKLVFIKK